MMLPDFPSLKNDVERLLELAARAQASSVSGVAGPLTRLGVYEGDRHVLVRENGEVAEGAYETVSAEESLESGEVETVSLEQAFEMYTGMMCEIRAQEDDAFVELANREAESRGQVVEGAGRPLPEVILEVVEKMEIDPAPSDVDDLFLFRGMRVFLQDIDEGAIEEAREELKREPYKTRMDRLLNIKREEHRARESSRKLVG